MLLSPAEQANFNYMLCSNEKQLIKFAQLYSVLAVAMFNENSMEANIVRGNKETFSVLCDVAMFCEIKSQRTNEMLSSIVVNNPDLIKLLKLKNNEAVEKLKETVNKYELGVCNESTSSTVMGKLDMFNPNIVAPDTFEEKEEEEDTIEETDNIDSEGGLNANEGVDVEGKGEDELIEENKQKANNKFDKVVDNDVHGEVVEQVERNDFEDGAVDDIKYNSDSMSPDKKRALEKKAKEELERNQRIKSIDETASSDKEDDIDVTDVDLPDDGYDTKSAILSRIEAMYKSCLELDKPFGMLYEKGMLTYKIDNGRLKYIPGQGVGGSLFERLYRNIVNSAEYQLENAPDLRNVPNFENIQNKNCNYYPGHMFRYALGVVEGKTYKSWNTFQKALDNSLEKRLKQLFKSDENFFYNNTEKIESCFGNTILVLYYERGVALRLRISFNGCVIDHARLESAIKSISTYANATISISNVAGLNDVIDVQVIQREDDYLNKPAWAYQAMQVKLNNGEVPSLIDGLPIGRTLSGEGLEYKMDPSSRFMNFLAAGSGAGKGVLTLSLVAAAIGSGIPVFYIDYKPDMAAIFWEAERELGIKTFTFDGRLERHRGEDIGLCAKDTMPVCVKGELGQYASLFVYLRALHFMCSIANKHAQDPVTYFFVFDEIQGYQENLKTAIEKISNLIDKNKPKKDEEGNEVYNYCWKLLEWIINVNANFTTYINTTGRTSGVCSLYIGQSAIDATWKKLVMPYKLKEKGTIPLFDQALRAGTVCKILGKGQYGSKYGLGGANISETEKKYITGNRHFAIYDGNAADTAEKITVFKPFLTLNYDDPRKSCWTKGLGKMFGAGSLPESEYIDNVRASHPGVEPYSNQWGIHKGTGLLGLASMYCGGNMEKVATNLSQGYAAAIKFLEETNLSSRYNTPEEFLYDLSIDGLINTADMQDYRGKGKEDSDSSEDGPIETDLILNNNDNNNENVENIENVVNSENNLEKPTGVDKLKIEESMKKEQELMDAVNVQNNMKDIINDSVLSVSDEEMENMSNNGQKDLIKLGRALNSGDISSAAEVIANNSELFNMLGKDGRLNQVDLTQTAKAAKLTRDNSLDCTDVGVGPTSWFEKIYEKTPRGSRVYFDKLFKSLLEEITANGVKPSLVTRVGLYENNMFINNKICNLNGVIGGVNDIRLVDMIKYKKLFKKFKGIKELRLDMDFVEAAMNEYKLYTDDVTQVLERIFKEGKSLTTIELKTRDGSIEKLTRAGVLSKKAAREIQERENSRKLDAACMKVGSKPLEDRRLSEKFMAWDEGSLYNGAKFMFKNVGKANKDKPSFGGTLLWGGLGIGLGIVTTPLWVGIAGGKRLFRVFR